MRVAKEGATYVVTAVFTDEDGAAVVPNAVTWTLTNGQRVINSRSDVVVSPASTINIVLSGDDLLYTEGERRVVVLKWNYDSTLGTNLPMHDYEEFLIDDYPHVPR